ncbi:MULTISPECIES: glycoside hydrolase family 19 protein [unclassified Sphingomonas]|jgi:putative chitinase|uniref:glycoside hydrolase family 19 protein n=1 Tax=Sphingomonas TaxID=13687 RepID=UPI000964378B|nr:MULTISPECIES: glycoside hydrolase family 19 protein [unclassified Sphingomonas]MBN8811785.1 glycoside hydrolase [Sphingomonas sp.]OJY52750.1 MAG: glycoside hydrolase [Sphingomonas sp. 67-41]
MLDVRKLQQRLGVEVDGALGPGTFAALFAASGAAPPVAAELGLAANVHFRSYRILANGLRLAHFLAQCAHESGGFRHAREVWGPTAAQRAYEGSAKLGNDRPGDGKRYLGRGPGQLTGRANYRLYGRKLGIDLERHPELLEAWSLGLLAFCAYWDACGLNAWADRDDLRVVSNGINRGDPLSAKEPNGWADRQARHAAMKALIL